MANHVKEGSRYACTGLDVLDTEYGVALQYRSYILARRAEQEGTPLKRLCPTVNVIFLQAVHGWMAFPVYLSANYHCVLSQMQDLTKEPQVLNWANPDKPRPRSEFYGTSCTMPRPTG